MARKKIRAFDYVHVRALVSFNGFKIREETVLELTPLVQGYIRGGFLEVMDSGEDQTGPSSSIEDVAGEAERAGGAGGEAGGKQGEGSGAGGHGSSEGVDQA